jgi:solute:Na+ symporter, SSS family
VLLLPGLLFVGWWRHGGSDVWRSSFVNDPLGLSHWTTWSDPQLPWEFVISLIVLTCLTYICSPWYGQKIFAAADERVAVRAVGATSVIVFLLYGSVQLAASLLPVDAPHLSDPQLAVPTMIRLWLPTGARGLAYSVLFAAASTTLAGVWSAMVAMAVSDFGHSLQNRVAIQRLLTLSFAAASWLGANLLVDDILNRLILANIPIAALSFALLGGFFWPRASRAGAWASVVVGTGWGLFCYGYWGEAGGYTWYWTIHGTWMIFSAGVVVSLCLPDGPRGGTSDLAITNVS